MQIADLLAPASVFTDMRTSGKQDLLRTLSKHAADLAPVAEAEIFAALAAREELGSTGMGKGIALPHARLMGVLHPIGLFARLRSPLNFEAIDGIAVDLVFVLLLPLIAHGEQMQALACVSRRLRDPALAQRLRKISDPSELHAALTAA
jgi:PTS system nitrogen regulatory IIA component